MLYTTRHGETPVRDANPDGQVVRFTQRVDGFLAASFGLEGGMLTTCPWRVAGDGLAVNADCGMNGTLQFALLDEQGLPLEGFDFCDCAPMRGNETGFALSWRGGTLPGREALRLGVRGASARLFSVRWTRQGNEV